MPVKLQITVDCHDPHAQCVWWAERLGLEVDDGHDFIGELLESGALQESEITMVNGRRAFADAAAAADPNGNLPRMYFQRVPEEKVAKNRLHFDVQTRAGGGLQQLVDEWVATGATLDHSDQQPGHPWAVMKDPEGNEFCLS